MSSWLCPVQPGEWCFQSCIKYSDIRLLFYQHSRFVSPYKSSGERSLLETGKILSGVTATIPILSHGAIKNKSESLVHTQLHCRPVHTHTEEFISQQFPLPSSQWVLLQTLIKMTCSMQKFKIILFMSLCCREPASSTRPRQRKRSKPACE